MIGCTISFVAPDAYALRFGWIKKFGPVEINAAGSCVTLDMDRIVRPRQIERRTGSRVGFRNRQGIREGGITTAAAGGF